MNQSDVLDNECTGPSPCRDCPRHLQGLDKNQCVDKCKRLAAYRDDKPWEKIAIPAYNEHGGKEMVEMENQKKREYHKTTVQPGPVKQARGSINKQAGGMCLIDGCDMKHNLIRGLCKKHYQAWRKGIIKHPILGEFTVWQAKSQRPEVGGRESEVKEAPGIVRESADQGEKVQVKIIPVEETSGRKPEGNEPVMKTPLPVIPAKAGIQKTADESTLKNMADVAAKEVVAEIMAAKTNDPGAGLILNLDNYPKIKREIDYLAEKFFVTPEHVIIDMLGWALATYSKGKD